MLTPNTYLLSILLEYSVVKKLEYLGSFLIKYITKTFLPLLLFSRPTDILQSLVCLARDKPAGSPSCSTQLQGLRKGPIIKRPISDLHTPQRGHYYSWNRRGPVRSNLIHPEAALLTLTASLSSSCPPKRCCLTSLPKTSCV